MFAMNAIREISDPQILWSGPEDRTLKMPEGQLLDAIASGDLDDHLVAIADAVHARRELVHTVRSATAIAQLCIGDTVMFNGNVRPRYLQSRAGRSFRLGESSTDGLTPASRSRARSERRRSARRALRGRARRGTRRRRARSRRFESFGPPPVALPDRDARLAPGHVALEQRIDRPRVDRAIAVNHSAHLICSIPHRRSTRCRG